MILVYGTPMNTNQRLILWLRSAGPMDQDIPRSRLEWNQLTVEAIRLGLAGLLLEQVSKHNIHAPQMFVERLQASAMIVTAQQMNMMRELERLLIIFHDADLPVMLLKGAALRTNIYKRPDLRPMSDLDLLVKPQDAVRAIELLTRHGCTRGIELIRDDYFPAYYYEVELLTQSSRPVRIDLHARPFRPLRISRTMPDDALWEGSITVPIGESHAQIPRPELMFIHLAAHAAYHGCSRMIWLYDIKRFVDHFGQEMDWSVVIKYANAWRLSLPVLRAIESCMEHFGRVCPFSTLQQLHDSRMNWQDHLSLWQTPRDASSPAAHLLCNFVCTPGWRFPMGYLAAHLMPSAGHLADLYPYRHPGWILCAHGWRGIRMIYRVMAAMARKIGQPFGFGKLSGLSQPTPAT